MMGRHPTSHTINWKTVLDTVTSFVMIVAAVAVVSFQVSNRRPSPPEPNVPSEPVPIDTAALKGSSTAATVLIVFSDFECPYCGSFARDTMPHLEREYIVTGQLQIAYRYLPLQTHPHALGAAQAAECAKAEGQFWPMHDRLFSVGAQLDDSALRAIATSLRLDNDKFIDCLGDETRKAAVARDIEQAKALGLKSTPAFLLGRRTSDGRVQVAKAFYGTLPVDQFRPEIDRVVNSDKRKVPRLFGLVTVAEIHR
jgi:protein-disulfide isomerase